MIFWKMKLELKLKLCRKKIMLVVFSLTIFAPLFNYFLDMKQIDYKEVISSIILMRKYSCKFIRCDIVRTLKLLLTLSWRRSLSYRNQSIDLLYKSMDWFPYDRDLCHKRFFLILQNISASILNRNAFINSPSSLFMYNLRLTIL